MGHPLQEKDVDCVWDTWSDWGGCSKTCGGGTHDRIRSVKTPAKNNGAACTTESSFEVAPCHTEPCGDDHFCTWADWGAWELAQPLAVEASGPESARCTSPRRPTLAGSSQRNGFTSPQ